MTDETWQEQMCKDYVRMQARMQSEINRLRRERDALQRRLDTLPSTLTELQDRVSLLESKMEDVLPTLR